MPDKDAKTGESIVRVIKTDSLARSYLMEMLVSWCLGDANPFPIQNWGAISTKSGRNSPLWV